MSIKMRVVKEKETRCSLCKKSYMVVKEMYDIGFIHNNFTHIETLCDKCLDDLFLKILRMTCQYNARVKDKEDMKRINNADKDRNPIIYNIPINPPEPEEPVKKKRGRKSKKEKLQIQEEEFDDSVWEEIDEEFEDDFDEDEWEDWEEDEY